MSRTKQVLLLLVALGVTAGVVYLAQRSQPRPAFEARSIDQLAWLPAESGLVAGVDVAVVRRQEWLVGMLDEVAGAETATPDYQAFVQATGFDYARDLDRLWLGLFGASDLPTVVGVAEGRFDRARITAHALRQNTRVLERGGVQIYEVETEHRPPRHFAFAFLDESYLAFGSDGRAVAQVVDCWQGRAAGVGADPARRAEVERLAAGQAIWAVDELAKWQPQFLRQQKELLAVVSRLAVGSRVGPDGLALEAEALCQEPQQARRLRDTLYVLATMGRIGLARESDKASQAAGEALGNLKLTAEGGALQGRVQVTPETLAALLDVKPPASTAR